jgi:hypothetical protein
VVHGYHPYVEDAEIYLPGVEKVLHPELFSFNAAFFQSHAHLTLFPNLIAASVRLTHLPLDFALFFWDILSILLLLYACWELSGKCFSDEKPRWAGVALVAALFTLPIAGTSLYIMDQYINPRNLTAFAGVLAVAKVLDRKYLQAAIILVAAALFHPLMSVFITFYCMLLAGMRWLDAQPGKLKSARFSPVALPFGLTFGRSTPAYHQVAISHSYFYLTRWEWYEWIGALAPIAVLWWFGRLARRQGRNSLDLICRALIPYLILNIAAALVLCLPVFESTARLQPMRSLYLLYVIMILAAGGFLAEFVLKNHAWRWGLLFVPLCAGMFIGQRELFPASAHIEWPGVKSGNPWVQAFVWIRNNTPVDAYFALDPNHMEVDGEDENGFRAIAQRSMLADAVKDSGAVTMFPPLAETWLQQVNAQSGWQKFQLSDFERLKNDHGVNWVVVKPGGVPGLNCTYQNQAVAVCRIE